MPKPLWFLVALLVLASSLASGQTPAFDVRRLTLGKDSLGIWLTQGDQQRPIGTAWDELRLLPGQPSRLWRTYRMENEIFGPLLDTVVFELPSLRAFTRRTIGKLNSDSLTLDGDSLLGWQRVQNRPPVPVARTLPRDVMDANGFDLAIRSLDWSPGASFAWRAYLPSQDSLLSFAAAFDGQEEVQQRDGTVISCWRIKADYAGSSVTFWIDPRSRALVKQASGLSRGAAMVLVR